MAWVEITKLKNALLLIVASHWKFLCLAAILQGIVNYGLRFLSAYNFPEGALLIGIGLLQSSFFFILYLSILRSSVLRLSVNWEMLGSIVWCNLLPFAGSLFVLIITSLLILAIALSPTLLVVEVFHLIKPGESIVDNILNCISFAVGFYFIVPYFFFPALKLFHQKTIFQGSMLATMYFSFRRRVGLMLMLTLTFAVFLALMWPIGYVFLLSPLMGEIVRTVLWLPMNALFFLYYLDIEKYAMLPSQALPVPFD